MSESDSEDREVERVVVLDFLPRGESDGSRAYGRSPVAYGVSEDDFELYKLALAEDTDVSIGDWVGLFPEAERHPDVEVFTTMTYGELSNGALSELPYAVEEVVGEHEQRFVDFYNDAQPITLRLHQLNLLPGIGKKLRNNILDERKRGPFGSFEDVSDRVAGLHDPRETLVDRIMEELEEDDLKYRAFVRPGREET